jgi:hypothetical protein
MSKDALKDFTIEDLELVLRTPDSEQGTGFFEGVNSTCDMLVGMLIKQKSYYKKYLTEDTKMEAIVTTWKQLTSMELRGNLSSIKNVYAYVRSLLRGHLALKVKARMKKDKKLKIHSFADFGLTQRALDKLQLNEYLNDKDEQAASDKRSFNEHKIYRIPVDGKEVNIRIGEILEVVRNDKDLWRVFKLHYVHYIAQEVVAGIMLLSTRSVERRVNKIKNLIQELAVRKSKENIFNGKN